MVTTPSTAEAVSMSRDNPSLAIGLHWDVWGEDEREFDTSDLFAVKGEFRRQLEEFERLLGRLPTHIDSHRHAHREEHLMPLFREMVEPLGIPLRGDGRVRFVGGFYAQWEWMKTELKYVSVEFLQQMLREEVVPGFTEFSCHPGYIGSDYHPVYNSEREEEVRTLLDPRIRETLYEERIQLISYADYPRLAIMEQTTERGSVV